VECIGTKILSSLMQFVFLSEKNIFFLVINRAAFYIVLHSFYEIIACVINILQSFVKISGGITISASQLDVIVNIRKKDVTN